MSSTAAALRKRASQASAQVSQHVSNINNQSKQIVREDFKKIQTSYSSTVNQFYFKNEKNIVLKANSFGYFLVGVFFGLVLYALTFPIVWGWMDPVCVNNCNAPYGYCNENNVCICTSPVHSGRYCEFNACGGCSQNSTCGPYIQRQFITPVCRDEDRTEANNFRESVFGWQNAECQKLLNDWRVKRYDLNQPLTTEESNSFPQCLCETPWNGRNCDDVFVPQNAALQTCSGKGNKSVGLFDNNTVTGEGAQCAFPFRLLDYALTAELKTYIIATYPTLLWKQYCGRLVFTNASFYVVNSRSDMKCYCEEGYEGEACELGICPVDSYGEICSGNGAPNLGLGLEFNTTIKKHDRCDPICDAGFHYCIDEKTCKNASLPCDRVEFCPKDRPFRCRNEDCISGLNAFANGEQGYREYFDDEGEGGGVHVITLTDTVTEIQLSSPLVAAMFPAVNQVELVYFNKTFRDSFSLNETFEFEDAFLQQENEGEFLVLPNLFVKTKQTGRCVVIGLNGEKSLIQVSEGATTQTIFLDEGESSTYFYFLNPDTGLYMITTQPNGEAPLDVCQSNPTLCLFFLNGSSYEPFSPGNLTVLIRQPVLPDARSYLLLYGPELQPNQTYYLAVSSSSSSYDTTLSMFLFVLSPEFLPLQIKYVMQQDLVRPSICSPYQDSSIYFANSNNQSYYNELWYADGARQNNSFVYGDRLVYYSFLMKNWERGFYRGNGTIQNVLKASINETNIAFARVISKTEYGQYLVECPSFLSYYNGQCVWPFITKTNYNATCVCDGQTSQCECEDGSLVNVTSSSVQCELYANGLTLPVRYIYKQGNWTVPSFVGGTRFYENNVTEVFYGNFSSFNITEEGWSIGGYSPLGWFLPNVQATASSNTNQINNTNSSTFTYWEADPFDRNVYIQLETNDNNNELITSVLIRLRNASIEITSNLTLNVPVTLEVTPTSLTSGTTANNSLETYDLSGQMNETVIIYLRYPAKKVKLFAPYPFSVFEFAAFTNQNCTQNPLPVVIWGIGRNTLNETLVKYAQNITEENCVGLDCLFYNSTDMQYLNYTFEWVVQINKTNLKTNPNLCYLPYRCDSGKCSHQPCRDYYNCRGNGCIQPDTRSKYFKCACAEGYSGIRCELEVCKPTIPSVLEFNLQLPDPHSFCTCGFPNPLKLKPNRESLLRLTRLDNARLKSLNRLGAPRRNPLDVMDLYVRPEAAPYGIPVMVIRELPPSKNSLLTSNAVNNEKREVYSNCPYAHKGPSGQYLTLEDDVLERNDDGSVKEWRKYYNYETKRNVTYVWLTETDYDEFPYRCPNGECVAGPEYCLSPDLCNGHGTCRPDGTCTCSPGWTTFLYTLNYTTSKRVPYFWDGRYNVTNPSIWGIRNTNWQDFGLDWCMAKDCARQDCSVDALKGCFPGTPPLFTDAQMTCEDGTGCAPNAAACVRGDRTPLLNCSGNGIIRKRDYREEYYCECGFSATEKNGFGGPICAQYQCEEPLNKKFSQFDRRTKTPYYDKSGRIKRGVWQGFCGVHIGPDPNELDLWQSCCSKFPTLETCSYVPCQFNTRVECYLAEECIPAGGTPKVYPCNNHGTPRADGTCECERDETRGTGFVPDPEIGEDNNCFKQIQCPISPISNTPCNAMPFCEDPTNWLLPPNQPYNNDQIEVLLARLGNSISNETVLWYISNQQELANQKEAAYVAVAQETKQAIKDVATCICLLSVNDTNNTFPQGMLPYPESAIPIIQPYQKAFEAPYLIPYPPSKLNDDLLTTLNYSRLINGTDYLQLPQTFTFNFSSKIYAIRIHARSFNLPNQTIRFYSGSKIICPLLIVDSVKWDWIGPFVDANENLEGSGTAQYCDPIYKDFDYFTVPDYVVTCVLNTDNRELCEEFKREKCPGKYLDINQLNTPPRGCKTSCCILVQEGYTGDFLTNVTIAADNANAIITVDQVQFYGFADGVLKPVPSLMFSDRDKRASNCSVRPDSRYAQQVLGNDKSYFFVGTTMNYKQASQHCQDRGAWLATPISSVGEDDFNFGLAQACKGNAVNCLISGYDQERSVNLTNISEVFTPSCTAWGCYFAVNSFLDMYSARNTSIYVPQWAGSAQQRWNDTLFELNKYRESLNLYVLSPSRRSFYPGTTTEIGVVQDVDRNGLSPKDYFNIWGPEPIRYPPYNATHSWDRVVSSVPSGTEYSPYIGFILSQYVTTSPSFSPADVTRRKWTFQSNKAIYDRFGVTYETCNYIQIVSPVGYCGNYLADAFPYEFLGLDVLNYVSAAYTSFLSYAQGSYGSFNRPLAGGLGLALKGNVRSIILEPENTHRGFYGATFIFTVRTPSNVVFSYNHTMYPLAPFNQHDFLNNSVLIGLQVFPPPDALPFRAFNVSIRGEPWNSGLRTARDHTMGYLDTPYMGMRVFINEAIRFSATQTVSFDPNGPFAYLLTAPFFFKYNNVSVFNLTTPNTVKDPSVYNGSLTTRFTLDTVQTNFVSTSVFGRPIISCPLCEIKQRSFWGWNVHTYTRQGGFPNQFTPTKEDGSVQDSGVVIYRAPGGSVRLDAMQYNSQLWRWFTRQSTVNLIEDYEVNFGKDWCVTVNATTGRYDPVPCDLKYPFICIRDYTKYVALPGRTCDVCDYSSRSGGFAVGGKTCLDAFPLANATAFPFEHFILRIFEEGTLNLYLPTHKFDYDKARAYYIRFKKPIVWSLSESWELWNAGYVDRPGYSPIGANPYNWLDFSLKKHYPHDCGAKISKKTGIIYQMCARDISYCDPDLVFENVPLQNPQTILLGVAVPTPDNPLCGINIRPTTYVVRDRMGGPTPEEVSVIKKQIDGSLQIVLKANQTTRLYNTGKPSYVFEGDMTIYGTLNFTSTIPVAGNFTVWVSPLDPTYLYPSTKIVVVDSQPFNLSGISTYLVNLTITLNATYQTLGWEFYNSGDETILTVSNAIVSTNETFAKCGNDNTQPRYEPYPAVVSTTPINQCVYSNVDLVYYRKNKNVGECHCAHNYGGPSCDCPSINRVPCGGAYGTCIVDKCICQDIGSLFYQKLLLFGTPDYFKVYIQESVYNEFPYELITNDSTIRTLTETRTLALTAATTLPSFVNGDELDDFLSIKNPAKPVFVDLTRTNGNNIVWQGKGQIYDPSEVIMLGGEYPILNSQNWTLPMIRALNFNNLAFNLSDVLYDGSMVWYTNISSVTLVPEPTETRNVYVFAESANVTTANCVKTSALYHWICSAGVTTFNVFNISEVQQYVIGTISLYT